MNFRKALQPLVSCVGIVLAGWGLLAPLVWLPVIYDIRYTELYFLGGKGMAAGIVALMALSTLLQNLKWPRAQALAFAFAGGAVALLAGSLIDIYRWADDQVQQLGGEALLAKLEYRRGVIFLGIGFGLWAQGAIRRMLR